MSHLGHQSHECIFLEYEERHILRDGTFQFYFPFIDVFFDGIASVLIWPLKTRKEASS